MAEKRKVPVTVLTGFLGSGKTTLLNHILKSNEHKLRFAIIENEFGDIGVDEKLLGGGEEDGLKSTVNEEVIEVMNGCICCTVRGDLVEALKRLHSKVEQFDAVLIETTGMADPAPVAQTFFVDDDISELYRLDGIVTVVDAMHIEHHLDKEVAEGAENESVEQLAFADIVILNKCDLIKSGFSGKTEVVKAEHEAFACADSQAMAVDSSTANGAASEAAEEKLAKLESRVRAINPTAKIIRAEYSVVDPKMLLDVDSFSLDRVLELDPEFLNTGGEHEHDDSVSSVALSFPGFEVNVHKLEMWIGRLMRELGTELYRYKGILAVKGMRSKFVFQGVHMMFSGSFGKHQWADDEERECRFVFIGKNIKQEHAARLTGEFQELKAEDPLRFKPGDRVMANMGPRGWAVCKVLKLWDDGNPYRMEVQDGFKTNIWAPMDSDFCVKAVQAA